MRFLVCVMLAACAEHAPQTVAIAPLPVATQTPAPVVEVRAPTYADDGDFSSDKGGTVHLTAARDGTIAGTYTDGVLTCNTTFECRWYERGSDGRATFRRKSNGTLEGTWGTGESDSDGGSWTLVPVKRRGALDGLWDTNWGVAKIETTRAGIHVDYPDGTMECTERDKKLTCTWNDNSMNGAAEIVIESDRVLRGSWGNGASSTDGGAWVFVRR